MPVPNYL